MPDTITSLKKENDALKREIESLKTNFGKLQEMMERHEEPLKQDDPSKILQTQIHTLQTSLQFLSDKYDTESTSKAEMRKEMNKLSSRLAEIAIKVDHVGDALEQLQEYSYQYNIKILGLSERSERESAIETSSMCVDLFKSIGADVNLKDIDIAHRVPSRRQDGKPRPIICKFARRIAKEIVMNRRSETSKVNSSVRMFDHLTPKNQQILFEARSFKERNDYQFCWTKNSVVYLRKNPSSRAIRIKAVEDLQRLSE
jgi:chromosome segregation ATPase